jgi:hypothetical protein
VDSGNVLALDFATGNDAARREISEEAVGNIYFFRYLKIEHIEKARESGAEVIRMATIEPSSDMAVQFVVRKKVSLEKAAPLQVGEAVAVTGRVRDLGKTANTIVLDPVIVRYKDRLQPKRGVERLYEVDTDARRSENTTTGEIKRGANGE